MSAFDPLSWLLSFGGFAFEWMLSRSWIKILVRTIPLLILVALIIFVWFGGQMDRNRLADKYIELGSAEIAKWEEKLFDKLSAKPEAAPSAAANQSNTDPSLTQPQSSDTPAAVDADGQNAIAENDGPEGSEVDSQVNNADDYQVPSYEEMLYRRVELLRPNPQSQFVIGTSLLLKGAVANSQKMLRKIAPDDKEGLPKAHAIMALSYLNQYLKSKDQTLIPRLQHHADIATKWPDTPKDVSMLAADLNWQRGNPERSVDIIEKAAERFPELYPLLMERAGALEKYEQAESARAKAIIHYEGLLNADPKQHMVRIQIAQLLGTTDESLERVERLLNEGLTLGPSPELSRALSEVYRIRFVKHLNATQGKTEDFSHLLKAFEIDKSNPLISEQTARLVRDAIRPPRALQESLRDMLSSGEATVSTHAIMSEFYLAANRQSEAIMHLEKVFQAAPTEVKYANNLAYLYAEAGRMEEAQQTARKCLELLQRGNLQNQRFVDELLDTLGMINHKLGKNSDAIASYELALRFNPDRIDTRQKLASIYRDVGNEDVAAAHEKAIESIKKSQQERLQKEQAATAASAPKADPAAESAQPQLEEQNQAPSTSEPPQDTPTLPQDTTESPDDSPESPGDSPESN